MIGVIPITLGKSFLLGVKILTRVMILKHTIIVFTGKWITGICLLVSSALITLTMINPQTAKLAIICRIRITPVMFP